MLELITAIIIFISIAIILTCIARIILGPKDAETLFVQLCFGIAISAACSYLILVFMNAL